MVSKVIHLLGFGFVEFEEEEVIDPIIKKHFIEIDGKMVCFLKLMLWLP